MQKTSDEGRHGSAAEEAGGPERLDKNSYRVELLGGGWVGAVGHAKTWRTRAPLFAADRRVEFALVEAETFFFGHAAALLVVQGMLLQDFFPPDIYFASKAEGVLVRGPFLLLKGELSLPHDPPLRLKNMVLAHNISAPETLSREELLSALLDAIS